MLHQRVMELEEGRRLEDDGKRWDPARSHEERGQTEQKAVAGGQSRGASTGALTDQQLMFQQQGLGGNRADPTGPQKFGKNRQEVNEKESYFPPALDGTTRVVTHKTALATSFSNSPPTGRRRTVGMTMRRELGTTSVSTISTIGRMSASVMIRESLCCGERMMSPVFCRIHPLRCAPLLFRRRA